MDEAELRAAIEEVNGAIRRAVKASSYSTGDYSITRAALAELRDQRTQYIRQLRALTAARQGVAGDVTIATFS